MRKAAQFVLAVGFFDGVHLGHKALLAGADAALTFRRHPLEVLAPDRAPILLMTPEDRLEAVRRSGVREVVALDFTAELARTEPAAFLRDLLARADGRNLIVRCGANWRFGRDGRGDAAFLRERGVAVEIVPYAVWGGEIVSSSRIRKCLAEGRVGEANAMLGRPYEIGGQPVRGKGLGREMGFPTVNLDVGRPLCLRAGAYAVEAGGARGVANYGLAPTLRERAWTTPTLEIHFFGVPPASVERVAFLDFLRPERTFDSVDSLRRQIAADCERAQRAERTT